MEEGEGTIRIRPVTWYDLWVMHRYRGQVQYFDNSLALTRGYSLRRAFFGSLSPSRVSYTALCRSRQDNQFLIGQVNYCLNEHSARLGFVLPERSLESPVLGALLEDLAWQAADRGALHLLAEVDERSRAVDPLRWAGFTIYAWQKLFKLNGASLTGECPEDCWQPLSPVQKFAVRSLYQTLAPPLVQGAESLNGQVMKGLIYCQDGEVMGYAEGHAGPRGIYLTPIIHPNVAHLDRVLLSLLRSLAPSGRRPVYLGVRSYQSWVQPALEALGAQPGPQQALMIKHMVQTQRVGLQSVRSAALERAQPIMAGPKAEPIQTDGGPLPG